MVSAPGDLLAVEPHLRNSFLANLSDADFDLLGGHLHAVDLPSEKILLNIDEPIERVYFPHGGAVSLFVRLQEGATIETGILGRDSLIGGTLVQGKPISLHTAVVQIACKSSALDREHLRSAAAQSITLQAALAGADQMNLLQAQQSAACFISHNLEARLARWLLRCRDLTDSDDLALTQEFLSLMLGVRRTSVSLVAGNLQQAGLISYRRGHIRIRDLDGLRDAACECYYTVRTYSEQLLGFQPVN